MTETLSRATPVVHCVAVRVPPQGVPAGVAASMLEVRRWTCDADVAERWHAAATGSRIKSFSAAEIETLPPKLKAEASSYLGVSHAAPIP